MVIHNPNLAGAIPLYEESLRIKKAALGDSHPEVAIGLCNFGGLKLQLGDRAGARELIQESVDMLRRFHPEGHPDVQSALGWLAECA